MRRFRRSGPHPGALHALLVEAQQHAARGQTGAARKLYGRVVAEADQLPPELRAAGRSILGQALLAQGDLAYAQNRGEALAAYGRAAELIAVPVGIRHVLAHDAALRGDTSPTALRHLARYCTIPNLPFDDPVLAHVQRLCFPGARASTPQLQLAELLAGYVTAAAPGVEWAHFGRGQALLALGRPAEALSALEEAERLLPTRAASPFLIGRVHQHFGRADEAYRAFRRSLDVDLHQPDALLAVADVDVDRALVLGCAYARRDDWTAATAAFARARAAAAAVGRSVPDLDLLAGVAAHRAGDVDVARELLERAQHADPGDVRVLCALGRLALDDGDPGAAPFAVARAIDPDCAEAAFGSAAVLDEAGDLAGAAAEYEHGLRLRPDWRPARLRLAELARVMGTAGARRSAAGPAVVGSGVPTDRDGRPADAPTREERHLRANPLDLPTVHRLAVLAHRTLREAASDCASDPGPALGEAVDDPHRNREQLLVACWVTLLHSDAFWRRLAARTGRDSSPADREAVADAFAADLTRLLLDRGGSDGRRLAVDLGLERRAADAVARFVSETTVPGWPAGIACGPLMLARAPEQAMIIGAAAAGGPGPAAERVRLLLSPLGRGCHLLEEDLLDEAVAELEPLSTTSPVARERYHEALVRLAVEQAEERRWGPAVTSFIRAARDGADVQEHANLLREAVSGRMRELAAEDGDDGSAVVEMIEVLGPFMTRDATFDADAAASYAKLARQVNNAHDYEAAVELLDKALDLMPDDRTIRRFACVATRNLADDLLDVGTWASVRRAFALLDRSRGYDDGDATSAAGMSRLLLGKAHKLVEREHLDVAEAVAREALRHDDVPLGWCILATVHVKRGRRGDACAALLDGRRRHPHDTELRETHDRLCSRAPTARGGTP